MDVEDTLAGRTFSKSSTISQTADFSDSKSASISQITESSASQSPNTSQITESSASQSVNTSRITESSANIGQITESSASQSANISRIIESSASQSTNISQITESSASQSVNTSRITESSANIGQITESSASKSANISCEEPTVCSDSLSTGHDAVETISEIACSLPAENTAPISATDCFRLEPAARAYAAAHTAHLTESQRRLTAVLQSQRHLATVLRRENERVRECAYTYNVTELLDQLRVYTGRLATVQRSMTHIHARCAKLKSRAQRVQQASLARAEKSRSRREAEAARQRQLVARRAGNADTPAKVTQTDKQS